MTRPLAAALLLLPWGPVPAQPSVHVTRLPVVPEPCEVGTLGAGAVFETPTGAVCMVVSQQHDPAPPYVLYSTPQFPRPFDWYPRGTSYYDPPQSMVMGLGVGTAAVAAVKDAAPDVWVTDLSSGTLFRLPADTWARLVADARFSVRVGPRED